MDTYSMPQGDYYNLNWKCEEYFDGGLCENKMHFKFIVMHGTACFNNTTS